jgi:hypothetical protein
MAGTLDGLDLAPLPGVVPRLGRKAPPPSVTFILQTGRPFDPEQVARAATGAVRRTAHGKTYYEVREVDMRTLYMPSDRIIVLSSLSADELGALLTSDGRTPTLSADTVALVRSVEAHPCWAVVPFEGEMRERLEGAGPKRDPTMAALTRAKGVAAWCRPDGDRLRLGADVVCAGAADAAQVAQSAGAAWNAPAAGLKRMGVGLMLARLPRASEAYGQLTGSLTFTAQGTTARATADVSRKAVAGAAEELDWARQGAGFPGGIAR